MMHTMMKGLILASVLISAGCAKQTPDLVAMKIEVNAMKQELEYLRQQTEELDPRVRSAEQMALQVLDEREAPVPLDCEAHKLGILRTRLAQIAVVCEEVLGHSGGYTVKMKLGNPTSARLDGVHLTLYAGSGAVQGRSDTRMHYETSASLSPGGWRAIEVELPGLPESAIRDLAVRAQVDKIALAQH
jgi:hypothetical protein